MALKLGTTTASLYLGSQIADRAYLGTVQVPRVLYFNDAEIDGAWTTLGNWWFDAAHTVAATSLPTAADSVVASAGVTASGQTVVDFTMSGAAGLFFGTLTVTGNATFNDSSETFGTVTGNATFNDSSYNSGTVTGNATFNDSSGNSGTVTGNATFNDSSGNSGTVTGNAAFTGAACNSGTVDGTITGGPLSCE
jgi:hypothetical protein